MNLSSIQTEKDRPAILFLSEVMPLGGTSNFAINICAGLRAAGNWTGIAAALREPSEVAAEFSPLGLPMIGPDPTLVLYEERIEYLYRKCSSYAPSAVVGALSSGSFDFLRYVPEGCLRIAMIQSDDEGVYQTVLRYIGWIDIIAGVSSEICRKMESRLPAGSRVRVIHQPYGVPMPDINPQETSEGPLRILYLGRVIEEQKRVSLMARVIKATLAAHQELSWTIVGDGPQLESLKTEFATASSRVQFLGAIPYQNVPNIISGQHVYFLCSDFEGLPLSLLESMGAGLVPVVSDLASGISEVVNDRNGIRVPINDEQGYVDAILKFAEDRDMLTAFSKVSRETVRESHSTAAMTRRWEEMLAIHASETPPFWNQKCRATVPLDVAHKWYLKPWLRPLRAAAKRINRRIYLASHHES